MFKAETGGSLLYIIIAVGLMVLGAIDKYIKKTKEMAQPPASADQEEQTDEYVPDVRRSLEDIFKQMQRPVPASMEEEAVEEIQSLETIPAKSECVAPQYMPKHSFQKDFSKPQSALTLEFDRFSFVEEEQRTEIFEYDFDLREAVIYNEILQRKYE